MYKFWTVQDKKVLDIVKNNGYYTADISKSNFVKKDPALKDLYAFVTDSFNKVNGLNLDGLIFAFAYSEDNNICFFKDYNEFSSYIKHKNHVIASLWKTLGKDDYVVMELEYKEDFNPIYIDMNDFQYIMPPFMVLSPYTEESHVRIINNIKAGEFKRNELPSDLIQAHIPVIEKENIINVYPTFK